MDVILSRARADAQECDLLVSGIFQDERPLQGTTGWIDWRLNGRLSRLVMSKKVTGDWKETTLIPSNRRIIPKMILLLGLGRTKEYSYLRLREIVPHLLETLKNLHPSSLCLSLPDGEERYNVDCGKLTEIFLEGVADGLDRWEHTADEEWIKALRLFFGEGENRASEILLGVQAAQSSLRNRLVLRVLVPSHEGKG